MKVINEQITAILLRYSQVIIADSIIMFVDGFKIQLHIHFVNSEKIGSELVF